MNVLFLTIDNVVSFDTRSIYMDLANKFRQKGHFVTIVSVCEQRDWKEGIQEYYEVDGGEIIKIFSPNVTKVPNYILKGIALMYLCFLYRKGVARAIRRTEYDLILYGSPPVTVYGAVELAKKTQHAYSYLLLKDIWPYDSVFDGALSTKGLRGIAFRILQYMARRLYNVSDTIGCMSPANIKFLTDNEPELDGEKIEVNPNCVEPFGVQLTDEEKIALRQKYRIPTDKIVFLYGGNLGKPQGIDFVLKAVKASRQIDDAVFVFVGAGTEAKQIQEVEGSLEYSNLIFLPSFDKNEYEQFVYACDVGLIFLNHKCLAPNYPSRLLSYMQASLPVICATDTYTDIGKIAVLNGYGLQCESNNEIEFVKCVQYMMERDNRIEMGKKANEYFHNNYTSDHSYNIIMNRLSAKARKVIS